MLKRFRDPNQPVEVVYKYGPDQRWRWTAYYPSTGKPAAVSPVWGYDTEQAAKEAAVSILTRPEGRMRPGDRRRRKLPLCFNPHPTRRPDATWGQRHLLITIFPEFQSSPDPKAGCDESADCRVCHMPVSILTRPEGRMRRELCGSSLPCLRPRTWLWPASGARHSTPGVELAATERCQWWGQPCALGTAPTGP